MTEEYKQILLRYLTGNLNFTPYDDTPQFEAPIVENSNLYTYINTNAGAGFKIIDIIQNINSNNYVLYGNKSNNKGFIVIIDETLTPIQYIDSFSSGTTFGQFYLLKTDEEGKFYGIDKTTGYRFIMLNNITIKLPSEANYSVKLKRSYFIPSPLSTATEIYDITKSIGQSKYLIGATIEGNPIFTELTINVGTANEWINYESQTIENFKGQSLWASWDENNLDFKASGVTYAVDGTSGYVGYWEIKKNNDTLSSFIKYINQEIPYITNERFDVSTVILNKNISYVAILDSDNGSSETLTIYQVNVNTDYVVEIANYGDYTTNEFILNSPRTTFRVLNGRVYFLGKVRDAYNSETGTMTAENTHLICGMIDGVQVNQQQKILETSSFTLFLLSNVYNLYNYNVFNGNYKVLIQQVYNPANYNGVPYEDNNALIPNSAILYSNNNIVFARNLYNKTIYNNTVLSSVQIPNALVNNISITPKLLIGKTNQQLVNSTGAFTKNIYETVYVNFYTTLLIEDRNTENYTQNISASSVLNNSVSISGNYFQKRATKYRILFEDGTIITENIIPTITNNIATYNMKVVIPYNKNQTEIQIISNDETTIYQRIDISNLEKGKIYNITQDCYVEEG